jgi:hypothetical protein
MGSEVGADVNLIVGLLVGDDIDQSVSSNASNMCSQYICLTVGVFVGQSVCKCLQRSRCGVLPVAPSVLLAQCKLVW